MGSFIGDLNRFFEEEERDVQLLTTNQERVHVEIAPDPYFDQDEYIQEPYQRNGLSDIVRPSNNFIQNYNRNAPVQSYQHLNPSIDLAPYKRRKIIGIESRNSSDYSEYQQRTDYSNGSYAPRQEYLTLTSYDEYSSNTNSVNISNKYILSQPQQDHYGDEQQLSVNILPDQARSVFSFPKFNRMQSRSFQLIYEGNNNCVISSPTGSGKTVLFELAILKLHLRRQAEGALKECKILYMAPTKALCSERYQDWCRKFSQLKLTVGLLTSDTSMAETDNVRKSDIIICTAEKWDLLTRRWSDYSRLFELVKLLLVDEIHVLKDKRGSTLEVVVTRMKRLCSGMRIVALSATVPNIEDVSLWLRENYMSPYGAQCLVFGEEYRAVKLNRFVYGFKNSSNNDYQFDNFLNSKVLEMIRTHFKGKPVLVFCPTRSIAVSTAKYLKDNCYGLFPSLNKREMCPIKDRDLGITSNTGVAYHHAGLSFEDRRAIELNFISGAVKVLCSTSTLAVGVNLPAYLVIVKGTKSWVNGELREYSDLDLLQMLGRAGRPQFEKEGCAVVLTDILTKSKYERIVQGTEKLESSLHLNFAENLAAEIMLKTITSIDSAVEWLKSTFFFTRYMKNPNAYNDVKELRVGSCDLEQRMQRFCQEKLNELLKEKIVIKRNKMYESTTYCDSMSRHYVQFETIKLIIHASEKLNLKGVLKVFSTANEFKDLRLKHQEKKLYKEVNSSPLVKFSIDHKEPMTEREKVFLLTQYELGGLEYPNYNGSSKLHSSFINDKNYIFKQSPRIIRCMIDVFIEKKDAVSLLNALKLGRCLSGHCWEDSVMVLRQLQGIGLAYVRKFASHNILSLSQAQLLKASDIEYFLGMRPGNGNKLKKDLKSIPKISISSSFLKETINEDFTAVDASFRFEIRAEIDGNSNTWHGRLLVADVITEVNGSRLIDFRRIPVGKIQGSKAFKVVIPLKNATDIVRCHVACSEVAGTLHTVRVQVDNIPDWKFQKLIPKIGEPEEENYVDEFDDGDDLEIDQLLTKSAEIDIKPSQPYQLRADGKYECNHACKDKSKCRHICCKEGLLRNPTQSTQSTGGCNHLCRDKSSCRHLCCREGLARQKAEEEQQKESPHDDEKGHLSFEHLHEKSGVNLKIPNLFKSNEEPGILKKVSTPEKKIKKLSKGIKRNALLDFEDDDEDNSVLDFDNALETLLTKPESEYIRTKNFKIINKVTQNIEPEKHIKSNTISDLTSLDDTISDQVQLEEKPSKIEESWLNEYTTLANELPIEQNANKEENTSKDDDDHLLDFLGSDIEFC